MSDTRTVRTTCKIGACEPYCGIEVDVTDGRMTAARGDLRRNTNRMVVERTPLARVFASQPEQNSRIKT